MEQIKDIMLEFSCFEKSEISNKSDKSFHCSKCATQVIDFTNKSLEELHKEIDTVSKPICGIFKKAQLSEQFLKYAATTLIITSSLSISAFAQKAVKPDSLLKTDKPLKQEDRDDRVVFAGIVEVQATPIGGFASFYDGVAKNFKIPKGHPPYEKIFIELSIDSTGRMSDVKVIKGSDEIINQEIIRVIKVIDQKFEPAKLRGVPVKSKFIMPIIIDVR